MTLFTPYSFYYGDTEFPWEGSIEPKLFQRTQWLLMSFVFTGNIKTLCAASNAELFLTATDTPETLTAICTPQEVFTDAESDSEIFISVDVNPNVDVLPN